MSDPQYYEQALPGTLLFDRYEVLSHIGAGGMGHVYKVKDADSGRELALKTLVPKTGKNEKSIARFRQEFSAMQLLDHPNIVHAYELHDQGSDFLGFTMECVEGRDLDAFIYSSSNAELDLNSEIKLLQQVAEGLWYAHQRGLIHRDLKPANILVTDDMHAKIVDFGLAQQESDGADMSKSSNKIGTAYYMSPEQHRGEELDTRTDIYSFGILAFELLTKQRPFDGSTPFKLFLAHVSQDIPNVRKISPQVPPWVCTMIEICAEKKKQHRYSNMGQILSLFTAKVDGGKQGFWRRLFKN